MTTSHVDVTCKRQNSNLLDASGDGEGDNDFFSSDLPSSSRIQHGRYNIAILLSPEAVEHAGIHWLLYINILTRGLISIAVVAQCEKTCADSWRPNFVCQFCHQICVCPGYSTITGNRPDTLNVAINLCCREWAVWQCENTHWNCIIYTYSGTPHNDHPSTTAICDITANSPGPN